MENNGMTSKVSAFARAYHAREKGTKVYLDFLAEKILTKPEMDSIAESMTAGIAYFEPDFKGSPEAALKKIVNRYLAPSPLARAAFAEDALRAAIEEGAQQMLTFGAGLDSFACRLPRWAEELQIFEIDLPDAIQDKRRRLEAAGIHLSPNVHLIAADLNDEAWWTLLPREFDAQKRSFATLLGLSYYLSKQRLAALLEQISKLMPAGSRLIMDYNGISARQEGTKLSEMAAAAGETMQSAYEVREMDALLNRSGLELCQRLNDREIERRYFTAYNLENPDCPMRAIPRVCLIECNRANSPKKSEI